MNTNEIVKAVLDIQALKARYLRYVDTKNWEGLSELFSEDATLFFPEGQKSPTDVTTSIKLIEDALAGGTSIHHGHLPEIDILTPSTARGVWAMEDKIYWPSDRPSVLGLEYLHGYGHYHEDYVRCQDRWLIRKLKVTRLWSRTIAPARTSQ